MAKDSTQAKARKGKYVYVDPDHTKQDETNRDREEVWKTTEFAVHAERAMLLLPLFLGEDTERHIENVGGRIIFEASAGSWASTPDAPGKDKMVNRKDRGRPAPIFRPRPGVAMDAKCTRTPHPNVVGLSGTHIGIRRIPVRDRMVPTNRA